MIEVYRETIILVAETFEGLVGHHNHVSASAIIYNREEWPDGQGKIVIGSLSNVKEQKDTHSIKEQWDKTTWEKHNLFEKYKNILKDDYLILQTATYDFRAYDERCVYNDKSGIGYKYWFNHGLTAEEYGYPEYPDIGAIERSTKQENKKEYQTINWKVDTFGFSNYTNAREPSEEELDEFLEKIEIERKQEMTENLESWK
jgi:hypothetical protein